jgi:GxxExxY protein
MDESIVSERTGKHDELTRAIIGVFYDVYNELGLGFVESVYKECMRMALVQAGLPVETEMPVPVRFRGSLVGTFRADLVVQKKVLIELKVATDIEVALLMNFGPAAKFKRRVMDNENKKRKSVSSVEIGVKPLVAGAVIR